MEGTLEVAIDFDDVEQVSQAIFWCPPPALAGHFPLRGRKRG